MVAAIKDFPLLLPLMHHNSVKGPSGGCVRPVHSQKTFMSVLVSFKPKKAFKSTNQFFQVFKSLKAGLNSFSLCIALTMSTLNPQLVHGLVIQRINRHCFQSINVQNLVLYLVSLLPILAAMYRWQIH
jgi:hypothetical protein